MPKLKNMKRRKLAGTLIRSSAGSKNILARAHVRTCISGNTVLRILVTSWELALVDVCTSLSVTSARLQFERTLVVI